jgi:hypothetical protein
VFGAADPPPVLFETANATEVDPTLFELSVARALMVWLPLLNVVVSSVRDHEDVPLATEYVPPSTAVSTFTTLTLSEDVPLTVMVPLAVLPAAGDEMVTDGAVVSAATFENVTDSLVTVVLPEVSVARADKVCEPLA